MDPQNINAQEDPTARFSNRAAYYARYRPGYPDAVVDILSGAVPLLATATVADIGSGTGILSELFLQRGCLVIGVEPNFEMRKIAEEKLVNHSNFKSVTGTAENTTLSESSVDLISVGQALHWFDLVKTKVEFQRILRPGGFVAVVMNEKLNDSSSFMQAYDNLLHQFSQEYSTITSKRGRSVSKNTLDQFFNPGGFHTVVLENWQHLDLDGLAGRTLSMSHMPLPGNHLYDKMVLDLELLFARSQNNGQVTITYETKVYWGKLAGRP